MRNWNSWRLVLAGAVLALAGLTTACGSSAASSGGGTTPDTTAAADTTTATDTTAATDTGGGADTAKSSGPAFATIYPILGSTDMKKHGCSASACHSAKNAADASLSGKLDLSNSATAYKALVTPGAKDLVCTATPRVTPGDHANSTLWQRVDPTAAGPTGCAAWAANADPTGATPVKMPWGQAGLAQADADLIKAWIDGGANP